MKAEFKHIVARSSLETISQEIDIMIKLNPNMNIEYDGKGTTSIRELLSELGKQMNPDDKKEGHAVTRDTWHELALHALEFLKYCPFDCHHNLHAETQRLP